MKQLFRWKVMRWVLLGTAVVFAAIQFVPVDRSNPPVETEIPAPANVRAILRRACYDCHSNEPVWPWYSRVAPVSWLVASDVHEAREEVNFSAWNRIPVERQAGKLEKISEEVEEGEMPLWSYQLLHGDAVLSAEDRTALQSWALGMVPGLKGNGGK